MLLTIFFVLIAMLNNFSSDFDIGTRDVNDFDFAKLCICVLTSFQMQVTLITVAGLINHSCFH